MSWELALRLGNLRRPQVIADPYPFYGLLRRVDPVRRDVSGIWVLTRYADVFAALQDPRLTTARILPRLELLPWSLREVQRPLYEQCARAFPFLEPPAHTRVRGLLNRSWAPSLLQTRRHRIQGIVDELLDEAERRGGMDAVSEFAHPLAAAVLHELVGVPAEDGDLVSKWVHHLMTLSSVSATVPPEQAPSLIGALDDARAYFETLLARYRARPGDDVLSDLLFAPEDRRLGDEELLLTWLVLLGSGVGPLASQLASALHALLRAPDEMRKLREAPSPMEPAIEELLRFAPAIHYQPRLVREELAIAGRRIEPGGIVLLMTAAANRDPAQFPEPDRLDLNRRPNRHIAFGHGVHFCIGAPITRLVLEIALTTLLRRVPGMRVASDRPAWSFAGNTRGPRALPVTF